MGYYGVTHRRFTQADTIVPGGGANPQALNRYTYVGNNPVNYSDPTGHDPCPGGGGGCGGVRDGDVNGDGWLEPDTPGVCEGVPSCAPEDWFHTLADKAVRLSAYYDAHDTESGVDALRCVISNCDIPALGDDPLVRFVEPVWGFGSDAVTLAGRCAMNNGTCGDNVSVFLSPVITLGLTVTAGYGLALACLTVVGCLVAAPLLGPAVVGGLYATYELGDHVWVEPGHDGVYQPLD